jgi:hypothetical protein
MAQIDDGSEIEEVKKTLARLTAEGLVTRWEIPYEYLFTRLYSALFYLEPTSPESETRIWQALSAHGEVLHRANTWQACRSGFASMASPSPSQPPQPEQPKRSNDLYTLMKGSSAMYSPIGEQRFGVTTTPIHSVFSRTCEF